MAVLILRVALTKTAAGFPLCFQHMVCIPSVDPEGGSNFLSDVCTEEIPALPLLFSQPSSQQHLGDEYNSNNVL